MGGIKVFYLNITGATLAEGKLSTTMRQLSILKGLRLPHLCIVKNDKVINN